MALTVDQVLGNIVQKAAKTVSELDMHRKSVEVDENPSKIASGEFTYVCSFPPVLDMVFPDGKTVEDYIMPLGKVPMFNINESMQVIPNPEVGSKIISMLQGAPQYQINISKFTTLNGNVKYAAYKWMFKYVRDLGEEELEFSVTPGESGSKYFAGISSELYDYPTGLLFLYGDVKGTIYEAEVAERAYIMSNESADTAGDVTVIDNLSLFCNRLEPYIFEAGNSRLPAEQNNLSKNFKFSLPKDI